MTVRIDPSQFMLTKDNHRLMSAPVLADTAASVSADPVLPRTPEMDDIPEHVHTVEPVTPYTRYVFTTSLNKMYCFVSCSHYLLFALLDVFIVLVSVSQTFL